jgi:hypothetical protein
VDKIHTMAIKSNNDFVALIIRLCNSAVRIGQIGTVGGRRYYNGEMGAGRWKHHTAC